MPTAKSQSRIRVMRSSLPPLSGECVRRRRPAPEELRNVPTHRNIKPFDIDARGSADPGSLLFTGYASTFNDEYDVYGGPENGFGWFETIAPPAFQRTLSEKPDLMLLINHTDMPLARTKSGSLRLSVDDHGLWSEADLQRHDPDVQRLLPKMERKDMDEMSFAFRVLDDAWMAHPDFPDDPMSLRVIREVSLHKGDVSIVNYGANPNTAGAQIDVVQAVSYLAKADPSELRRIAARDRSLAMRALTVLSPGTARQILRDPGDSTVDLLQALDAVIDEMNDIATGIDPAGESEAVGQLLALVPAAGTLVDRVMVKEQIYDADDGGDGGDNTHELSHKVLTLRDDQNRPLAVLVDARSYGDDQCPDCGADLAEDVESCPNCGWNTDSRSRRGDMDDFDQDDADLNEEGQEDAPQANWLQMIHDLAAGVAGVDCNGENVPADESLAADGPGEHREVSQPVPQRYKRSIDPTDGAPARTMDPDQRDVDFEDEFEEPSDEVGDDIPDDETDGDLPDDSIDDNVPDDEVGDQEYDEYNDDEDRNRGRDTYAEAKRRISERNRQAAQAAATQAKVAQRLQTPAAIPADVPDDEARERIRETEDYQDVRSQLKDKATHRERGNKSADRELERLRNRPASPRPEPKPERQEPSPEEARQSEAYELSREELRERVERRALEIRKANEELEEHREHVHTAVTPQPEPAPEPLPEPDADEARQGEAYGTRRETLQEAVERRLAAQQEADSEVEDFRNRPDPTPEPRREREPLPEPSADEARATETYDTTRETLKERVERRALEIRRAAEEAAAASEFRADPPAAPTTQPEPEPSADESRQNDVYRAARHTSSVRSQAADPTGTVRDGLIESLPTPAEVMRGRPSIADLLDLHQREQSKVAELDSEAYAETKRQLGNAS